MQNYQTENVQCYTTRFFSNKQMKQNCITTIFFNVVNPNVHVISREA